MNHNGSGIKYICDNSSYQAINLFAYNSQLRFSLFQSQSLSSLCVEKVQTDYLRDKMVMTHHTDINQFKIEEEILA